ncbi:glycosyltransferase family 4 protein [Vibrio harveyi]
MRKVLVVEPFSSKVAGAQKVTYNVVHALRAQGNHVHVMCREGSNPVSAQYSDSGYSMESLPFERQLARTFGSGSFDGASAVRKMFFLLSISMILLALNIWIVYRARRLKCSVIYTYDLRGLSFVFLFSKLLRIRLVWHVHGEIKLPNLIRSFMVFFCDVVVCPSKYIALGFSNTNKVKTIYNGFEFSDSLKREMESDGQFRVTFIGTVTPQKGLHFLVDALKEPLLKGVPITLTVIGDSVGSHKYKQWILEEKSLELPKNVNFVFKGWSENVETDILKSSVIAFTSLKKGSLRLGDKQVDFRSSEALPTVPIESIAFGVPVVATNIAGIPEIVEDGLTGYIVNEPSTEEFAKKLLDSRSLYLKDDAVREHRNKFSLENMSVKINSEFL